MPTTDSEPLNERARNVLREVVYSYILNAEPVSSRAVAKRYDMLHPNASGDAKDRTPLDNQTVRSVFIIGPDKKIKATLAYPMSTGRNFDELIRLLDSCQLTAKHKVATPANWKQGDDVIIVPAVSDEEAKEKFPNGWDSPKPYIRIVPQPD